MFVFFSVLTVILYLTFLFSVHIIEGPHMRRIYANKSSSVKTPKSKKTRVKKFD